MAMFRNNNIIVCVRHKLTLILFIDAIKWWWQRMQRRHYLSFRSCGTRNITIRAS